MPQTISKIGIKNSSGTGYDTRDIGAKGQNVEVGYDASGKIILDVNASTPVETKQLTKVLQDVEKNISDLENSKGTSSHAWTDADGVNYGLADGTHYGHIKVGNGLTVNSGKVDVAYGNSANTACQGNDSRLSNARKNPNAVTFSDGTTNVTYDGSAAKTVTAATVGAAPAGHTSVQATSSILGHVKTGTGIANNSGTISVSYGTAAGTACQGNDSRLSDARTPKSHAATTTTYGGGNSSNYGHVKLTDTYSVTTPNASTNGANTGIAASAYALQQAYNTLNSNLGGLKFGIDSDGNYGYIKAGADSVTPFSSGGEFSFPISMIMGEPALTVEDMENYFKTELDYVEKRKIPSASTTTVSFGYDTFLYTDVTLTYNVNGNIAVWLNNKVINSSTSNGSVFRYFIYLKKGDTVKFVLNTNSDCYCYIAHAKFK